MNENELSNLIIGAAIEVHRVLGPGLLEGVYEEALCQELRLRGIEFKRQVQIPITYKGTPLASSLRIDLLVGSSVIVELKAKEVLTSSDQAQTLTYLRLSGLRLGLLINFSHPRLADGLERIANRLGEDQNF